MALDYRKCAQEICDKIGGAGNVKSAEYCQTRLRFELLDDEKADKDALEEIEGVRGVIESNGQLQIIIGTGIVGRVYEEYAALTGNADSGKGNAVYDGPLPGPGVLESIKNCLVNFATFSGRTGRSEYWYFTIAVYVVNILLGSIGSQLGVPMQGSLNVLQLVFSLVVLLPGMAAFWRRMHDIGKSGIWYLLKLIPFAGLLILYVLGPNAFVAKATIALTVAGWLYLLAFELRDSQPGENQYGMSHKYPLKRAALPDGGTGPAEPDE